MSISIKLKSTGKVSTVKSGEKITVQTTPQESYDITNNKTTTQQNKTLKKTIRGNDLIIEDTTDNSVIELLDYESNCSANGACNITIDSAPLTGIESISSSIGWKEVGLGVLGLGIIGAAASGGGGGSNNTTPPHSRHICANNLNLRNQVELSGKRDNNHYIYLERSIHRLCLSRHLCNRRHVV